MDNGTGELSEKKRKPNESTPKDDDKPNTEAGTSKELKKKPPRILHLPVAENYRCFDCLFDYIPLQDLLTFTEQVEDQEMRQGIGEWCRKTFNQKHIYLNSTGIYIVLHNTLVRPARLISEYADKVVIKKDRMSSPSKVNNTINHMNAFKSLTKLRIHSVKLADTDCNNLQHILHNITSLSLVCCNADVYFKILDFCTNLKHLQVIGNETRDKCKKIVDTSLDWLVRRYPKLEHFHIESSDFHERILVPTFLELNRSIRSFSTNSTFLVKNSHAINSHVKLDVFELKYDTVHSIVQCCKLLNRLKQSGFYQKIHFSFETLSFEQNTLDVMATLNGLTALRVLESPGLRLGIVQLSGLLELEELYISHSYKVTDWVKLPWKLVNLRHIGCKVTSTDDIAVFTNYARKLESFQANEIIGGTFINKVTKAFNLSALNRNRRILKGATKVTIYVDEEIYLATKAEYVQTDYDLIQVKRIDSYEHQPFSFREFKE